MSVSCAQTRCHIYSYAVVDRDDLLELRTAFEAAVKPTPDNVKKCSEVDAKGFRFLVTTMTTVASYFGDPPMTKKDVAALTADVFGAADTIEYTKHAIVDAYVSQDGNN
ncbi:hypothetical protein B5M09_012168 [Aphanomyces astaci]|uniref:Uncharacterized protein n=1 Tax=Aphanomyces astaci TaxID=112090 RepID=A0A3R7ZKG4_APHAT|nr:hypothetical protein B5M09_012168 [Aphanomyces astaci]